MNIVIEGVDGVGKTSFAHKLADRTSYQVVKGSSFEIAQLGTDGMFQHMMSLLEQDNLIIDRFHISNLIYGTLYKYPTMSNKQFKIISQKLKENSITIFLYARGSVIKKRLLARGDDYIDEKEVDIIRDCYKMCMDTSLGTKMNLSFDTEIIDFNLATLLVSELINLQETKMFLKG